MPTRMHSYLPFLIKPASADCNLFCDYCFYRKTAADYSETSVHRMTPDTFETLVQKAQTPNRKAVSYIWQGGEPMLMGLDFFRTALEIQGQYEKPGQQITNTIQTNAVAIDDQWAAFFKRNNILVGISIDGPREMYDLHRFTRNRTSVFNHVLNACDTLDRHQVEYNILAVVNNDTVGHPDMIYDFFRERQFNFIQFIECIEVVDGEIAPFSVDPDEYGDFLCRLFDRWLDDGYPQVNIRLFDNYLQYRAGMLPECCMYKNECGEYLVVEHNGDLYPCDFFVTPEWKLGNVITDVLDTVIDSPKRTKFASKREIPHKECETCPHLGFCQRGCIKFRWLPTLDYGGLNHMCRAYKRFFEYADEAYRFLSWDIMRRHHNEPVPGIGRNDPCPCGSGMKYKQCCMKYQYLLEK